MKVSNIETYLRLFLPKRSKPESFVITDFEFTGNAAYKQVTVKDTLQLLTANPSDISYTPSQCILGASWTVAPSGGSAPVRYEWSVGIEKTPPGNGLIPKQKEEVWHDAGLRTKAVFPVSRDPTCELKNIDIRHMLLSNMTLAWPGSERSFGLFHFFFLLLTKIQH